MSRPNPDAESHGFALGLAALLVAAALALGWIAQAVWGGDAASYVAVGFLAVVALLGLAGIALSAAA